MKNYSEELVQTALRVQTAADGFVDASRLQEMVEAVQEKCRAMTPGIMLYGLYNAGKSTLLNALLGREAASVSDIPETNRITAYDYHGYRLFDSPGIDAPIEHERLSRKHLEQVEVVIFVISASGISEERSCYEEIVSLAANKQLIVVLNDKDGMEDDLIECYEKVAARLVKLIPDKLAQIPLLTVNAASALKARREGKALLLEKSNIVRLEQEIARMMAATTVMDSVRTTAGLITPVLNQAEEALQKHIGENQVATGRLRASGNAAYRIRRLHNEGNALISQQCSEAMRKIRAGIDGAGDLNSDFCHDIVLETTDTIAQDLEKLLCDCCEEIEMELGAALKDNRLRYQDDLKQRLGDSVFTDDGKGSSLGKPLSQALRGVTKETVMKSGFALAKIFGKAANKCKIETIKKILIFLGKSAKGAGKIAGKIVPVLQIGAAVLDIRSGYKEDQAEFEARKAKVHAVNQALEQLQHELKTGFFNAWKTCCDEVKANVDQFTAALKNHDDATAADLRNRLDGLARAKSDLSGL